VNCCGMRPDSALGSCHIKMLLQVEFQSTQPNPVFYPMVPLKHSAPRTLGFVSSKFKKILM
jgi:hypothetical protein